MSPDPRALMDGWAPDWSYDLDVRSDTPLPEPTPAQVAESTGAGTWSAEPGRIWWSS